MSKTREARITAGLTLGEAARRARICVTYLRRVENHGAPYCLALRLSHIYECPIDAFLNFGGQWNPTVPRSQRKASGDKINKIE